MATNQDIIDQALGELGVVESGDSASATDSADALSVLNQMMAQWAVSNKDLNWFVQDTLTDTIPIPDWAEEGIVSNLAVKCAATFRVPLTGEVQLKADQGERLIVRTLINLDLKGANMNHLPRGESWIYNITSDVI